ncbi:MAG: hypothetical protein SGILL_003171, partial [Bacillariaceae sp.]
TMYQVGLTRTVDRVTTDRCNAMIRQLSKAITNDKKSQQKKKKSGKEVSDADFGAVEEEDADLDEQGDDVAATAPSQESEQVVQTTTPFDYWIRCDRARAILESMELFQSIRDKNPGKLPVPLPLPNHDTYFQVLRMYASQHLVASSFIDSAEDFTAMQEAPILAQDIVKRMGASQELLALQPSAMHWNQVLIAYANSSRPKRPLEAATLLYKLDADDLTDQSSFSHALRCCGSDNRRNLQQQEKLAEISIAVAERVWKGLKQRHAQGKQSSDSVSKEADPLYGLLGSEFEEGWSPGNTDATAIQMASYHFVHMMRDARNFGHLSSLDPSSFNQRQTEWIKTTLQECIQYQKINIHVLLEVVHQATEIAERTEEGEDSDLDVLATLFPENGAGSIETALQGFRGKRKLAQSRAPGRIAKELLRQMPSGWTSQAD